MEELATSIHKNAKAKKLWCHNNTPSMFPVGGESEEASIRRENLRDALERVQLELVEAKEVLNGSDINVIDPETGHRALDVELADVIITTLSLSKEFSLSVPAAAFSKLEAIYNR
jgi:hypothetical protein